MIEKINKLIDHLMSEFTDHSIEIIKNNLVDTHYNILLIKNLDIVKIYKIELNKKLEQVDVTQNMLGLINNIRRKNLCVR